MVLPAESPMVRRDGRGAEVGKGGQPDIKAKYRGEFAECGICIDYAPLAWRCHLSDGTGFTNISSIS